MLLSILSHVESDPVAANDVIRFRASISTRSKSPNLGSISEAIGSGTSIADHWEDVCDSDVDPGTCC